jgi:hypothetical protein
MPAVRPPYMDLTMVLELVISHCDESFCLQKKHCHDISYDFSEQHVMRGWDYLSAGNLERGNISLADFDALHPWPDLLDDTAELVTEDVALVHLHDGTWRGFSLVCSGVMWRASQESGHTM